MATIPEALALAIQHHQAGRLQEAEQIYRQILAVETNHADALHLLGVLALQVGQLDLAAEYIARALGLNGNEAGFHNNLGNVLMSQGKPEEAAASYRRALELKPDLAKAHHNLGNALMKLRKPGDAVASFQRALALNANLAKAHNNLGQALKESGRLPDAEACFHRALELEPGFAEAHNNLGNVLADQGKLDDAVARYRRALELSEDFIEARINLGNALREKGNLDAAVNCYRQVLEQMPESAEAYSHLGSALNRQGHLEDAVACCHRALELKPDFAEAHNNLGLVLRGQGKLTDAVACYGRAVQLNPEFAEAHNNLGEIYRALQRLPDAIACCRRALELKPNLAEAHINLGGALQDQGMPVAAAACYRRILELSPESAGAYNNLGNAYKDQGNLDEASAYYRRALELKPDYTNAYSNLLFVLNYGSGLDAKTVAEEHNSWNRRYAVPLAGVIQPHANERSPDRRLRIGYVSPDFRSHSVAYFIEPILANHDLQQVEVFCYAEVSAPDTVTARLRSLAHQWRWTCGLSDEQLAALVRADGIDVLIDLAGHTTGNRLLVFARKPAPIQVTYLGYPNTTGLWTIDYRLTDAVADPPGVTDGCHSEQLVRLPGCFVCYRPPAGSPLPNYTPVPPRRSITFGSFNTLAKIGPDLVGLWSKVLSAVSGSRLLLKAHGLADADVRRLIRERFTRQGVASGRLELRGWEPAAHLQVYHEVDVALDTFPYNGTTTTCEALWMGVPVVTLAGTCHAGRVGASLLSCIGLGDLTAATEADYVGRAQRLAEDRGELAALRTGLRDRVRESPLCDEVTFTRRLEEALRDMWRRWCAAQSGEPGALATGGTR